MTRHGKTQKKEIVSADECCLSLLCFDFFPLWLPQSIDRIVLVALARVSKCGQVVRPIRRATVAIQRGWLVKTNIRRFPTLLPISSSGLGWLSFSRYTRTEGTTDPGSNPGIGATLFARCFFLAAALAVWMAWGARLDRFPHAPVASFFDSSPHMHVWVDRLAYESTHKQHARTARCVPSTHPFSSAAARWLRRPMARGHTFTYASVTDGSHLGGFEVDSMDVWIKIEARSRDTLRCKS